MQQGKLTLFTLAGLTSPTGNGTASVTFGGSVAEINAAIDGLTYTPTTNFFGTDALKITVNDNGLTDLSGAKTAVRSIALNVTSANEVPALDLDQNNSSSATGSNYQAAYLPLGVAAPIADTDASIADLDDANIESATITISNVKAGDILSVNGTLPGTISASAYNALTGVLTLSGSGTLAQYQTALRQVEFSNGSGTPDLTQRDISVVVFDGNDNSNTAHTFINLNSPPTAPTDSDLATANAVTEGATAGTRVGITASSTDPELSAITYSLSTNPGNFFAIDPSGVVTVSAAGATGINYETATSHDITVKATDADGASNTQSFTINVGNVAPTPPVDGIAPDGGSVEEGAANGTAVGIKANSTDVNGGTVTFSITAGNTGNAFEVDSAGVVTVADATQINFEALTTYTLTIQASDGTLSTTQDFTLSVTNATPSSPTDTDGGLGGSVSEGASNSAAVGITASSTDPNGGTVTYTLFNNAGGRFAIDATSGVVTVADASLLNFETDTSHDIVVRASDPAGAFSDQLFTISVTNVPPVAVGDSYSVNEDATLSMVAPGTLGNDSDVNGGTLTAVLNAGPANAASFTLNSDGSFTYTPNADFNGSDSFSYAANDGTGAGSVVSVLLTINEVNDAPTAVDDLLSPVAEDSGTRAIAFSDLTGNDLKGPANEAAQSLTVTAVNNAVGGTVAIVGGQIEFTPTANFNGIASFDYTTTDDGTTNGSPSSKSDVGQVSFAITAVNDAPVLARVTADVSAPPATGPKTLDSDVLIGDVDSATLASATVRVSAGNGFAGENDILAVAAGALAGTSITASYNAATNMLTLSGVDTLAHYEQVLENITFHATGLNSTNFGANRTRTIEWQLNDGSGANNLSAVQTTTVNLTGPPAFDFNGDGSADILWQSTNGTPAVWLLNGSGLMAMGPALPNPGTAWKEKASGDFNGDGKADVLWQHSGGAPVIWLMDGGTVTLASSPLSNPGPSWHANEAADFNGDGKADILWQNDNGTSAIWLMDGVNIIATANQSNPGPTWHQKAAADFNGDGKADILWQNDNGTPAIWLMDGTNVLQTGNLSNPGPSWHAQAAGDFNGDGKADILWQNDNGTPAIWLMDGTNVLQTGNLPNPGPSWHVKEAVDINGDGKADILWQNDNGMPAFWLMDGVGVQQFGAALPNPGAAWQIV